MAIIRKQLAERVEDSLDGNKTPLTHRVTALACAYLDGGGFKPVETEVSVASGWIADIASFIYPTKTEAKNLKLIPKLKYDELELKWNEFSHKYSSPLTAIVEVKTSVQDFKKDLERKFKGCEYPAHLCYLAIPDGLITEIPKGWIGIITDSDGQRIKRIQMNYYCIHAQNPGDITDLIAQVAIRRDHRTRYAAMKAFAKAYRSKGQAWKRELNIRHVIEHIVEYLKGETEYQGSMAALLGHYGVNIPKYLADELAWLEQFKQRSEGKRI